MPPGANTVLRLAACAVFAIALQAQVPAQAPAPPPGGPTYSSDQPPLTVEQRADIFMARRDYDSAIILLSTAVKEKKASADIYNRLGIAYQQTENFGGAERYYKLAIKAAPKNGIYYNNLGTLYYERAKYSQAIREYQEAIKRTAGQATFYVNLGSAEFAIKKYPDAMAAYRQALVIDPNALFPSGNGGTILQDLSRNDEPRYHFELSRLFCSLGQIDDAMHQFRQAMDLHYSGLKQSLTDPAFAPLRARPDFRALMNLPPLPPATPTGGRGGN